MNLTVFYSSNKKYSNHKYYVEVIDNFNHTSIEFELATRRFIIFEKRRIRKRILLELNKSKLLLENMNSDLGSNANLQYLMLKTFQNASKLSRKKKLIY